MNILTKQGSIYYNRRLIKNKKLREGAYKNFRRKPFWQVSDRRGDVRPKPPWDQMTRKNMTGCRTNATMGKGQEGLEGCDSHT